MTRKSTRKSRNHLEPYSVFISWPLQSLWDEAAAARYNKDTLSMLPSGQASSLIRMKRSRSLEDIVSFFVSNCTKKEAVKLIKQYKIAKREELKKLRVAKETTGKNDLSVYALYGKKFNTTIQKRIKNRIAVLSDDSGTSMSCVFGAALSFFRDNAKKDYTVHLAKQELTSGKKGVLVTSTKEKSKALKDWEAAGLPEQKPTNGAPESWTDNITTFFEKKKDADPGQTNDELRAYIEKRISTYQQLLGGLNATEKVEKTLKQCVTSIAEIEGKINKIEKAQPVEDASVVKLENRVEGMERTLKTLEKKLSGFESSDRFSEVKTKVEQVVAALELLG